MDATYFDNIEKTVGLASYKGVKLSAFPPLLKNVSKRMLEIENFESRDDDVILSGYPKSGSHWTYEMLNMVLSGKIELLEESKETLTIEMVPDLNVYNSMPSPRIIATHLQYRFLPKRHREYGNKIIYIVRNPKDCAVSCYHHFSKSKMSSFLAPDWKTLLENFIRDDFMYGGWFRYAEEWFNEAEGNPAILTLTYENCKKDLRHNIQKLAGFLGKQLDASRIDEIVRKCNMDYMKQHKFDDSDKFATHGKPIIYRKGVVGDWKNMFTVAQSEEFDLVCEEKMKNCPLIKQLNFG